jgi:isopentenyl diphosphate isomerase/L-lactate dehydrogenase-like FMN-dependent dehydrogenase
MIFDFVDGAAEDERTAARNRAAFADVAIAPRALVDVGAADTTTTVCEQQMSLPLLLAPAGGAAIQHPGGELAAARAAAAAGLPMMMSTASSHSIERVAGAVAAPWFQTYITTDRGLTEELIERARAAGAPVLAVTTDCPTVGFRQRDARHGMKIPQQVTPQMLLDAVIHPLRWSRWVPGFLRGPGTALGTLEGSRIEGSARASWLGSLFNPRQTWADLEWLRERWDGPLLLKGILRGDDALRAAEVGVDGIVVSNHGGRQLDGAVATLDALGEIREALGDRQTALFLDGGVRRGSDIFKAIALGADACLIGRAWHWGLAAGGEAGVRRVLDILATELQRTMTLAGVASVTAIDQSMIRPVGQ